MKRRTSARLLAVLAAGSLFVAACSSDSDQTNDTTEATTGETTADTTPGDTTVDNTPMADAWAVDTADCIDEAAANAPIEGEIKIGSVMPLTGGAAAAAFAPVKDGFLAYMDYANENGLLGDLTVSASVEDDQYNKDLTPDAVSKLIDGGVNLFSGIIGSANNAAVRDTLNEECIPQLNALTGSPEWGRPADYPWTTGILVPYTVESKVYAKKIAELHPEGATVALFYVNNEFGQVYVDAFKELASEYNLEIIDEQTIEATDGAPPTSQLTSIAAAKPDVIMSVPLGAGCIGFLGELAAAKAQNAGWEPDTFITNTCASSLILQLSGAAADGVYTSNGTIDVGNPANAEIPNVKEYLAYMESKGYGASATTGAAGWNTAEMTIAIIKQAMDSPEGLTRASIINAARNVEYTPMLAREGVLARSMGESDPFLFESLQVLQIKFDAAAEGDAKITFTDLGDLITEFESK